MEGTLFTIMVLGLPIIAVLGGLISGLLKRYWQHQERLKLIESGLVPEEIGYNEKKPSDKFNLIYYPVQFYLVLLFIYFFIVSMFLGFTSQNQTTNILFFHLGGVMLTAVFARLVKSFSGFHSYRYQLIVGCAFLAAFWTVDVMAKSKDSDNVPHYARLFSKPEIEMPVYGGQRTDTTRIPLEQFSDYVDSQDHGNPFTMSLWHGSDSLFIRIDGIDAFPEKRVNPPAEVLTPGANLSPKVDQIRLLLVWNGKADTSYTYHHYFNNISVVSLCKAGEFVPGSNKPGDIPFHITTKESHWQYLASVPLKGQNVIWLSIQRTFYGRHGVIWPGCRTKHFIHIYRDRFAKLNMQ